jgi:phospholipid/cholesterol/gamma-HCH transport system substrate-binding protein
MRHAIAKHLRDFAAIIGLAVIAAGVSIYILGNERLRFPWQGSPVALRAEFSTAQAVTPGQGQTVRVSGVRVGDISGVKLENGRAIVTMSLDPQYKDLVHSDASALLRPKTGLKDMFVELNPGTRQAPLVKQGSTLPIRNTLPDVNPDEILAALDNDTRDYLKLLIQGAGQGLKGRGGDLQEVFRRFEPTHRDLARVNGLVAQRHQNLRHLIHSLNTLNGELASKGQDLAQLIDSSSVVFRAFASEEQNVSRSVADLPATLRQTTQTLGKVQRYADVLGPAAEHLRPAIRALNTANHAVIPFATEAAPIVRDQIRPFVRSSRPIVRSLGPGASNLASATPDLTRTFVVLNHLLNLVGYNQNGGEGPSVKGRDEGYLFWIAWLDHNAGAVFSSSDANGPFRPVALEASCTTLRQTADQNPPLNMVLQPALLDPTVCGGQG